MPFKSAKQRTYMLINKPKTYKKWKKKYGSKVVRKGKKAARINVVKALARRLTN
jgi:hypothetical protein